jgi:hypothetical protein
MARPASASAPSLPVTNDVELSTLAYFLDGLNGTGSMSCAKEGRC